MARNIDVGVTTGAEVTSFAGCPIAGGEIPPRPPLQRGDGGIFQRRSDDPCTGERS